MEVVLGNYSQQYMEVVHGNYSHRVMNMGTIMGIVMMTGGAKAHGERYRRQILLSY